MIASVHHPLNLRPRVILAYGDCSPQATLVSRHFRRQGWEVRLASSGGEALRLARALAPQAIVLDTQQRGESGWLTCAKLRMYLPEQVVILVGEPVTEENQRFAEFVGASGFVARCADATVLFEEVYSAALAASAS